METMMGTPAVPAVTEPLMGPEEFPAGQQVMEPAQPAVAPDPRRAMMMSADDPQMQKVMMALARTGAPSRAKPTATSTGYMVPDPASPTGWGYLKDPEGKRVLPPYVDPETARRVSGAKKRGGLEAELEFNQPVAETYLVTQKQKMGRLDTSIDKAIDKSSHWTTGFMGAMGRFVPGTPQHDLAANLKSIQASVGIDAMIELKKAGGGLGSVTEAEHRLMQSLIANIEQSQSPEQLKENLQILKEESRLSWDRINRQYKRQYGMPYKAPIPEEQPELAPISGGAPALAPMPGVAPALQPYSDPEEEQRYQEYRRKVLEMKR